MNEDLPATAPTPTSPTTEVNATHQQAVETAARENFGIGCLVGGLVMLVPVAVVAVIAWFAGRDNARSSAVNVGEAYYTVDSKTGETTFHWGRKPQEGFR